MEERFERIDLGLIEPNPHNPRKVFWGAAFDELVASISEKGVLEPVLVRPLNGDGRFQLIAGERRFQASFAAGKIDIPAIIRPYSDEETLEVMAVENLQREDLTEIEEARGFKDYVDLKGGSPRAIDELAKAVGKSTTYIRRRVKVLDLPDEVLKMWEDGELIYSHLEHLIRLDNGKKALEIAKRFLRDTEWNPSTRTAERLADLLKRDSPPLADALFVKEICSDCPKNTEVQKSLFGDEALGKDARCLDPSCFKHHQNDWLLSHWHETDMAKKYGTNGFRFYESKGEYHSIDGTPKEKCKACPDFVTTVSIGGKVSYPGQCCVKADNDCFATTYKSSAKRDAYRPPLGPEFRNKFYREKLAEVWAADDCINEVILHVVLYTLTDSYDLSEAFIKEVAGGLTEEQKAEGRDRARWQAIESLTGKQLDDALLKTLITRLKKSDYWLDPVRSEVARAYGITLKDWKISADYLNKKDAKELVKLAKELDILGDTAVVDWLAKKHKGKKLQELDKKALVAVFLKSGVNLAGKVPKEILGEEA